MRANSNRQKDLLGHLSTCVWQSLQQQLPQNGRFVTQHRSPRRAEGDCQASSLSHFYLKALKCTDPSVHSFKLFPASSLIQHRHTENYRRSASVHELSPFTSGVQSRAWPPKALETVISQTGIQKILTRFSMKLWKWQGSVFPPLPVSWSNSKLPFHIRLPAIWSSAPKQLQCAPQFPENLNEHLQTLLKQNQVINHQCSQPHSQLVGSPGLRKVHRVLLIS